MAFRLVELVIGRYPFRAAGLCISGLASFEYTFYRRLVIVIKRHTCFMFLGIC